ncbi:MAG: TraR/DksA C4-type zinc finger protein [Gemmatimonadaceae bacterium]|nr:TraR/DksA C4-type zinc finger protein [Gemmatimonadaceae bacterium]
MPRLASTSRLSRSQLDDLHHELRREFARAERSVAEGNLTPEHDDLRAALQRMAVGEYGLCLRCESPIPYGRLQVMPATRHCITCAQLGRPTSASATKERRVA